MLKSIFKQLDWSNQVLGLCFLFASIVVFVIALTGRIDAKSKMILADENLMQQIDHNEEAEHKSALLKQHWPIYTYLQQRGIVGDTHRLQILELAHSLSHKLGLPLVDYTLSESQPLELSFNSRYQQENSFSTMTHMSINLTLNHEIQFAQYLEALRNYADALFSVKECEITRLVQQQTYKESNENFSANCHMELYSLSDVLTQPEALSDQ